MMTITIVFSVLLLIATTPIAVRSEDRGDINLPNKGKDEETDEIAYPYFNVHYHFNKTDWNRVLDDQQKIIALRRRVAYMKRQLNEDVKRTSDFIQRQDGLLTDARATLFERALYQTTKPSDAKKFKKQPADVHDRLHMLHGDFYAPVPNADFVDVNEPYYFQMLAEQHSF